MQQQNTPNQPITPTKNYYLESGSDCLHLNEVKAIINRSLAYMGNETPSLEAVSLYPGHSFNQSNSRLGWIGAPNGLSDDYFLLIKEYADKIDDISRYLNTCFKYGYLLSDKSQSAQGLAYYNPDLTNGEYVAVYAIHSNILKHNFYRDFDFAPGRIKTPLTRCNDTLFLKRLIQENAETRFTDMNIREDQRKQTYKRLGYRYGFTGKDQKFHYYFYFLDAPLQQAFSEAKGSYRLDSAIYTLAHKGLLLIENDSPLTLTPFDTETGKPAACLAVSSDILNYGNQRLDLISTKKPGNLETLQPVNSIEGD
ncbi:hypothetical protein JX580_02340 [Thiomicrospira microaerophila]|uniref:hypothetical protein n=1 Tax=Thiomicrospira microaerophila TaxID=406020 RepID=UPI00200F577B|nr:hypothetical protein [Thiomicrospira microaerophila]UQB42757.1 hypothetical protein JX580_02340 [Thiomicrospira microaerophila]